MRRAGQPDDIASMALFLASNDSEWITGTSMLVDGGFMARAQAYGQINSASWVASNRFVGPSFTIKDSEPRD